MEAHRCVFDQAGFHRSGMLRAVLDARAAGDARRRVDQGIVLRIDGADRASLRTDPAPDTRIADRDEIDGPQPRIPPVRAGAGQGEIGDTVGGGDGGEFLPDRSSERLCVGEVACIRTSSRRRGLVGGERVLPDVGRTGDRPASALKQDIAEFDERIVIDAVVVDDDRYRRRIPGGDRVQPLVQECRHPSHVDRHADDEELVLRGS